MKKILLPLICLLFIAFSCKEKDDVNNSPPDKPTNIFYDLNDDSGYDFEIRYLLVTTDGLNCSSGGFTGEIVPLNQNAILLKQNEYSMFNQLNDTIRNTVSEPLFWEYTQRPLVSIIQSCTYDHEWPAEWSISSESEAGPYYLAVKMNDIEGQKLGWIQLDIDASSGMINIIDYNFTQEDYIVIDK
ncbi:MAG: hypothetical protein PVF73_01450 [Bacteroidales bacterium]|jgi:hypothetical protein